MMMRLSWAVFPLVFAHAAIGLAAVELSGWRVEGEGRIVAPAADAAPELAAASLGIAYETPSFKAIELRPPAPIPLPDGVQRVRLWIGRVSGDFDVSFLIRDAKGEERVAQAFGSGPTFPAVRRSQMRDWSIWRQAESISLAAPTLSAERLLPDALQQARAMAWPRPFALAGIRIEPVKDRRDNDAYSEAETIRAGKGELWLTDLDWIAHDGFAAQFNWYLAERWRWGWDTAPRLFPDDLTWRQEDARWEVELRGGYQGPVVWRAEGQCAIDRAGDPLGLFARSIELPQLAPGRYYMTTKSWRPDGAFDIARTMQLFVIQSKAVALPAAAAPLDWDSRRPDNVFPAGTATAKLTLKIAPQVWARADAGAKCAVKIVDWRGRPVLDRAFDRAEALSVECSGLQSGLDYIATAEILSAKKVVDRAQLHFGVANEPIDAATIRIPDALPTRDETLMAGKMTTIAEHFGSKLPGDIEVAPATPESLGEFDAWLGETKQYGFGLISTHFAWGEIEALPGVYRFDEIDRRIALAARNGQRVLLTPAAWGSDLEVPRWLDYRPMLNQFGQLAMSAKQRAPEASLHDERYRAARKEWHRVVAARFLGSPTVIGYRTKAFLFSDGNKPEFTKSDYCPPAQSAFAAWLNQQGREPFAMPALLTIGRVSPARFGPDLSPQWRALSDFRTQTYVDGVRDVIEAIRSVDARRQIHVYRGSTPNACEAAIPLLRDGAEFHDEGGPFYFQRAFESMCLQAGVPYTNEGHQFTPPSKAMADSGFFYGSCFDRGWCWMYRWDAARKEDKRFADLPAVLSFIQQSLPRLGEWAAAKGDAPQLLVFGSHADQLLNHSFSGHYSIVSGIETFAALFAYHQLPAHFANEYADWVALGAFKAVFVVGDVMTDHALRRVIDHAAKGGKVVLVGDAGKYCAERPAERDPLKTALAGKANVRAIAWPDVEPPEPGRANLTDGAFDAKVLEDALAWAGVARTVWTETPGFEVVRKKAADGKTVYVALFRRWPGPYEDIWYDAKVEERWGRQAAAVVVPGLAPGKWRVEKLHRDSKTMGEFAADADGALRWTSDPATAGELQLFRLSAR